MKIGQIKYSYRNKTLKVFIGDEIIYTERVDDRDLVEDTICELMEEGIIPSCPIRRIIAL